ncbi:hypothetical protein F5B22DRAFT_463820 [Xylaria bambusicola]|uniref:uncharacterized protein n=1 Tax=Xylaria bambusicola TaxID=326684 RepID=UPI002008683B|nr:uncharacterized protein F5B22DRAFT_463820 [Xylaria bambusicola]KAI0522196.1 hypothetical protein F5B22DRAFT_463820 [Xylaria bambusicola]
MVVYFLITISMFSCVEATAKVRTDTMREVGVVQLVLDFDNQGRATAVKGRIERAGPAKVHFGLRIISLSEMQHKNVQVNRRLSNTLLASSYVHGDVLCTDP